MATHDTHIDNSKSMMVTRLGTWMRIEVHTPDSGDSVSTPIGLESRGALPNIVRSEYSKDWEGLWRTPI